MGVPQCSARLQAGISLILNAALNGAPNIGFTAGTQQNRNDQDGLQLTISAVPLSLLRNDSHDSQSDYDASAQVYVGGAGHLGSLGYASAVRQSSKLFQAAREAKC